MISLGVHGRVSFFLFAMTLKTNHPEGGSLLSGGFFSQQVGLGGSSPQLDTPPLSTAGMAAPDTPSERSDKRAKHRSSGPGVRRGGGEEDSDLLLPALETRVLDLKNHFPVAMKLLSLAMEDCQVDCSVCMCFYFCGRFPAISCGWWRVGSLLFRSPVHFHCGS